MPTIRVYRRPDLKLRARNLVLDGHKEDLLALTAPRNTWHHKAFEVSNYFVNHDTPNTDGCVHNVIARNYAGHTISGTDIDGWIYEHSTLEHAGCHDTFSPCPNLVSTVPIIPGSDAYRSEGFGITVGEYSSDITVRNNELTRVTKYSIGFKAGNNGATGIIEGIDIHDNHVFDSGNRGVWLAGVDGGNVDNNVIEDSHSFATSTSFASTDTAGITATGPILNVTFDGNVIRNVAGAAISYDGEGAGNTIQNTVIEGSCTLRNPTTCQSDGNCYDNPDIGFGPIASGDVALIDNSVTDSLCYQSLAIAPGNDLDVTADGGLYESGPNAQEEQPFVGGELNAYHIYYGGAQHSGDGVLTLDGGVTFRNGEDPQNPGNPYNPLVQGVVLAFGNATCVVKSASVIDYSVDYHLDDYLGGGTLIDCAVTPLDPLCQ